MSKVIVVGGGASGMMAALSASKNNNEVILVERNGELGRKLRQLVAVDAILPIIER